MTEKKGKTEERLSKLQVNANEFADELMESGNLTDEKLINAITDVLAE
ncbi:unnamed protein product, partial [marine sediment metagenome]